MVMIPLLVVVAIESGVRKGQRTMQEPGRSRERERDRANMTKHHEGDFENERLIAGFREP